MSDAYAAAGVDTDQADDGASAPWSPSCARSRPASRRGRSCPAATTPRCCASPTNLGIAIATDGVGSKLVVAEQADRLETVGIDCVAMNVNDLICVGAEPIALVDYLAVEQADPGGWRASAWA